MKGLTGRMSGLGRHALAASIGLISACLGVAEGQQRGVIVSGGNGAGSAGVIVSGGGAGSAIVSGREGVEGVVVDEQGRVRRFRQKGSTGNAVGAFSGGGTGGVVTGDFDPFDFVFGQGGFPGGRFPAPGAAVGFVDLDAIEAAFARGDFELALERAEAADRAWDGDPEIQQLRALTLFAVGNYEEAGRAVRDVLVRGEIWTWSNLRRLYGSDEAYVAHYQALRRASEVEGVSADTLMLLAYQNLVLGRMEAARRAIEGVLSVRSEDRTALVVLGNLPPDPDVEAQVGR